MLDALSNAWRVRELRRKLIFTLAVLTLYRLGAYVPLPGVNRDFLGGGGLDPQNPLTGLFGVFTGGAFNNLSVFALGIMSYISAAITMQLMTVALPRLQELSREGEVGQQRITQYTRYLTLALAFVQANALAFYLGTAQAGGALTGARPVEYFLIIVTLTAGVMLVMWMGEKISQNGLGNGMSLLVFTAVISRAPQGLQSIYANGNLFTVVGLGVVALLVVTVIVFVNEGQRRIPITYAKRQVGRRMSRGGSTYLPLKVNMAGVIPIIFASSLLIFPSAVARFAAEGTHDSLLVLIASDLQPGSVVYLVLYAALILAFTYFYTAVQFSPTERAEDLKKSGGYVPGIRPGEPTAAYLGSVVSRITLFGAAFLAAVALVPYLVGDLMHVRLFLGGTSMLIVVGVALDAARQMEAQLTLRNYEGFLKRR